MEHDNGSYVEVPPDEKSMGLKSGSIRSGEILIDIIIGDNVGKIENNGSNIAAFQWHTYYRSDVCLRAPIRFLVYILNADVDGSTCFFLV